MTGAPGWVDSASYDIEAKTTGGVAITRDNIQQLMESLLVSRFQLRYHRETRETTVFALEVAKDGAKLKPAASDESASLSMNSTAATTTLHAAKISMKDFAATLARQTGRPVVDQTGLAGEFDFDLIWSRDQAADATAPSVFAALQGLGLRLVSTKGQVEIIAIDKVERPSENWMGFQAKRGCCGSGGLAVSGAVAAGRGVGGCRLSLVCAFGQPWRNSRTDCRAGSLVQMRRCGQYVVICV